jgi:asparagine synthase (glutamine-hydrolysing)
LQAAHRCLRGQFTPSEVAALLRHWGLPAPDPVRLALAGAADEPPIQLDPADGVAWLEGCRYLRNQLLPDSDVMSMASALELRLPFVDATLQRQLSPIIPSLRLAPGKALLQASVPELPEWFKNRPKQGFRFPFQLWLDDPASPLNLQVPSTPAGLDLSPWYRRWNLMVLETWLRDHLAIDLQHP